MFQSAYRKNKAADTLILSDDDKEIKYTQNKMFTNGQNMSAKNVIMLSSK